MTPSAVSDTHAAIWYLNADPRLSGRAKAFIDEAAAQGQPVLISTITLVEVVYLQEKGKIPLGTLTRLEEALRTQDAVLRIADLTLSVALAVGRVLRDEVLICRIALLRQPLCTSAYRLSAGTAKSRPRQ